MNCVLMKWKSFPRKCHNSAKGQPGFHINIPLDRVKSSGITPRKIFGQFSSERVINLKLLLQNTSA